MKILNLSKNTETKQTKPKVLSTLGWLGLISVGLGMMALVACQSSTSSPQIREVTDEEQLESDIERLSYAVGLYFGSQASLFENLDLELLYAGIRDSYTEKEDIIFDETTAGEIIINNQQNLVDQRASESADRAAEYLAQLAGDESFTALESGIYYRIIEEGNGEIPSITDSVEVHYRGTLIDGTEFDSSYSRDQTAVFPINGVIEGWQQILQIMPVGSTWEVVIPPELAYGQQGTSTIGPNEILIFEINLIEIQGL